MAREATVAFTPVSQGWLGGTNYLGSLLRALADYPSAGVRPVIVLGDRAAELDRSDVPAAEVIRSSLLDRRRPGDLVRSVGRRLLARDPLLDRLLAAHDVDALSHSTQIWPSDRIAMIAWLPDFQHVELPELFSARERRSRDGIFSRLIERSTLVVLSSEAARRSLARFAPEAVEKARVLRFVTEPKLADPSVSPEDVLRSHRVSTPFVYLPNQFWIHKNHSVVIEALGILRRRGVEATVVATGDQSDHRNPGHVPALMRRAGELGVSESFRSLGRIGYDDVVTLMQTAAAVLNPSLCEGWSTSVEEARSLGKRTILSDIEVHREQAPDGAEYFDPADPEALAVLIEQALEAGAEAGDRARAAAAAASLDDRRRAYAEAYGAIVGEAIEIARDAPPPPARPTR